MSIKKYLECGKIVNTHGVRGAVRTECWCDSVDVLLDLETVFFQRGEAFVPCAVESSFPQKQMVVLKLVGVDSLEAAIDLKNTVIYCDRDDIPLDEGDHFIADLIGLPVIDAESGKEYGPLVAVQNYGAHDIYTVACAAGERMIPAVDEFIRKIDPENGIYVATIEGLLD